MTPVGQPRERRGEVGRCGDSAPTFIGGPPELCVLPAGHAGWHRSDQGGEWNDVHRPAAPVAGTADDAAPRPRPGEPTVEAELAELDALREIVRRIRSMGDVATDGKVTVAAIDWALGDVP